MCASFAGFTEACQNIQPMASVTWTVYSKFVPIQK